MLDLYKLRKQLEIDEGVKYEVYLDSLGYPTFGIGHLVKKTDPEWNQWQNRKGRKVPVSKERVEGAFLEDIQAVLKDCQKYLASFETYAEEVKQIVANMMFNMGLTKMTKLFKQFRQNLVNKNFKMAAKEMQYNNGKDPSKGESGWYKDTKDRAKRLITRMNKYADDYLCDTSNSKF